MLPFSKRSNRPQLTETDTNGDEVTNSPTVGLHIVATAADAASIDEDARPALVTLNDALEEIVESKSRSLFEDDEATSVFAAPKGKSTFPPVGPSIHRDVEGHLEAVRRDSNRASDSHSDVKERPTTVTNATPASFAPIAMRPQSPSHISIVDESELEASVPPPESATFEAPATVIGESEHPIALSAAPSATSSLRGRPTLTWALGLMAAGILFGVATAAVARGDASRLLARAHIHTTTSAPAAAPVAPPAVAAAAQVPSNAEATPAIGDTRPIPIVDAIPASAIAIDTQPAAPPVAAAPVVTEAPKADTKLAAKIAEAPKPAPKAVVLHVTHVDTPAPAKVAVDTPKPAPKAPPVLASKKGTDEDMDSAARALAKAQLEQSL